MKTIDQIIDSELRTEIGRKLDALLAPIYQRVNALPHDPVSHNDLRELKYRMLEAEFQATRQQYAETIIKKILYPNG